jgi:hypothetical protein
VPDVRGLFQLTGCVWSGNEVIPELGVDHPRFYLGVEGDVVVLVGWGRGARGVGTLA